MLISTIGVIDGNSVGVGVVFLVGLGLTSLLIVAVGSGFIWTALGVAVATGLEIIVGVIVAVIETGLVIVLVTFGVKITFISGSWGKGDFKFFPLNNKIMTSPTNNKKIIMYTFFFNSILIISHL